MRRFYALLATLLTVLIALLVDSHGVSYAAPLRQAPADGTIEAIWQYAGTANANYYHLVYWSDGLKVTGYYAEPLSEGQHPALIYNRGGNREAGALDGTELAAFAESGFVTVATQYRGVRGGEGQEQFGGADVHDVTNLITLLKSRPAVDPNRIVMFGGSRGGMMTYLALKWQYQNRRTDIKAAVTVGGIADLFLWGKQRPDLDGSLYPELVGASTRQNPQAFKDRSATYWPGMIRVPLLIEHGEADTEVSVKQAYTLYNLLRSYGRVVKLVTFKDGDHPLSNHYNGLVDAFAWYQKYIGKPGETFDFLKNQDAINAARALLMGKG
jgi:dipeptidyl aminopeptidase/acylaminoacyl peptidase